MPSKLSSSISLSQLNRLVAHLFLENFCEAFWVVAEISEAHFSNGGHLYLELVEMNEQRQIVAKARATAWANMAKKLQIKFANATGQHFGAGMKALLLVHVTFHEVYGYSLNLLDIDPTYTLGDQAQRRQQILEVLKEDGTINLNKELQLPQLLRRIAVISSQTAAGYGDFIHQLNFSDFRFETHLFAATMQGGQTEQSVIEALEAIYKEIDRWDVVVIIRGGGATSDLNSFDSYLLASAIAQFPIPVFTGIGHERDETVLDLIAHSYFKTPTAVATFLIEKRWQAQRDLENLEEGLYRLVVQCLEKEKQTLLQTNRLLELLFQRYSIQEQENLVRLSTTLEQYALVMIREQEQLLVSYPIRLQKAVEWKLEHSRQKLCVCEKAITMASPERILRMGFSMSILKGKIVTSVHQLRKGDRLKHRFTDGEVSSIVE